MSTRYDIEMAIHRITSGRAHITKRKLSISAVAEEAGISTATIHNRHPVMAEQIRVLLNKSSRDQRDEKINELKRVKAENVLLRKQFKQFSKYARLCPRCQKVKPFEKFHSSGSGLQCYCIPCHKKMR